MKYLSSLKNKNFSGQTCLLRVDFNITDADLRGYEPRSKASSLRGRRGLTRIPLRIERALPTIKFLTQRGAKIVILSHRGRPPKILIHADSGANKDGYISINQHWNQRQSAFSLKPFVKILSQLLKKQVHFVDFNILTSEVQIIKNAPLGSIFLLENLRFLPGEEKNDKKFAQKLASLGDFYVNDAFSVSHRKNASVVAITQFLPSYAGLSLETELKNLNRVMKPQKPLVIILGGAKISDKIGVIKNFLKKTNGQKPRADCVLTGGGIANTFFAAQGLPVGNSLYDKDINLRGLRRYTQKIILPIDVIINKRKILDIGPNTIKKYTEIIKKAKTIIWNGPMGYIEDKRFAKGTEEIMKAILKSRAFSVVGGGETTSIVSKVKSQKSKIFVSTGGGAMLEYLAGKKLAGIKALQ